jgi:uncharacterized protein (DUF2236 family)
MTPSDAIANAVRGTDSVNAKLTDEKVREMRRLHAAGSTGYKRLSKMFGVSVRTAKLAVRGETWSHVDAAIPLSDFEAI